MPPQPAFQRQPGRTDALELSPELSRDDIAAVRRQLRIRLLRDLVANGLYQVPSEALVDRLIPVVMRPS